MSSEPSMQFIRAGVSDDRLTASITIRPGAAPGEITALLLNAALDEKGISRSSQRDAKIAELLALIEAAPDQPITHIVAEGRAPIHPIAGRLEVLPSTITPSAPTPENAGAIDHHNKSVFHIVRAGDHIATIHPPVVGSDGIDVRGGHIAAKAAIPFEIRPDSSIIIEKERVIAAVPGQLIQQGNLIRIAQELKIGSSVDFSTGNIDFPGDVAISKGVRDCFHVNCGGDCRIGDLVEAATINIHRDAFLERGMAAREIGRLTVGRDLTATYLSNVNGSIGHNACISSALTHCNVKIGHALKAPNAQVAGGEILLGGASEVGTLGSDSAAPTSLVLGHIPELENPLFQIIAMHAVIKQRMTKRFDLVKALTSQKRLTPNQKSELADEQQLIGADEALCRKLEAAYTAAYSKLQKHAKIELLVNAMIHEAVVLWIGQFKCSVRKELKGPIRIWRNEANELVFTLTTSGTTQPLTELFKVIRDDRFKPIVTPDDVISCRYTVPGAHAPHAPHAAPAHHAAA